MPRVARDSDQPSAQRRHSKAPRPSAPARCCPRARCCRNTPRPSPRSTSSAQEVGVGGGRPMRLLGTAAAADRQRRAVAFDYQSSQHSSPTHSSEPRTPAAAQPSCGPACLHMPATLKGGRAGQGVLVKVEGHGTAVAPHAPPQRVLCQVPHPRAEGHQRGFRTWRRVLQVLPEPAVACRLGGRRQALQRWRC